MESKVAAFLQVQREASEDLYSVKELLEMMSIELEDILLLKSGLERLVDDRKVERKINKRRAWYRWKIIVQNEKET